jgi:hypothetical protein
MEEEGGERMGRGTKRKMKRRKMRSVRKGKQGQWKN